MGMECGTEDVDTVSKNLRIEERVGEFEGREGEEERIEREIEETCDTRAVKCA